MSDVSKSKQNSPLKASETEEGRVIYRPFINILADAIFFAFLAEKDQCPENDPPESMDYFSYSRMSILNTVFSLECAANMVLAQTELPAALMKKMERLPTLEKYDLLLFIRNPRKRIPREKSFVQSISELIELRNNYVHPKKQEQESELLEIDNDLPPKNCTTLNERIL